MANCLVVRELTEEILNPPMMHPDRDEDKYGSLWDCVILDTHTPTLTSDDVSSFIQIMNENNLPLEMYPGDKVFLYCENNDQYESNPADPRYKFNTFLYLYHRQPNGSMVKTCIGFVYYYAIQNEDGTFQIDVEYAPEYSIDEFHRDAGDYFKVSIYNDNDGVEEVPFEYIDPGYPQLYIVDFNTN